MVTFSHSEVFTFFILVTSIKVAVAVAAAVAAAVVAAVLVAVKLVMASALIGEIRRCDWLFKNIPKCKYHYYKYN